MLALIAAVAVAIAPPQKGQWAADGTGRITASTLAEFNRIAADLDASGTGQLGLLVVTTTNGANPRALATQIFNQWGIGHAGRNDGVLLFFALDDRKSEIVVGTALDGTTSETDAIMRNDVVANMKRGDLQAAVLDAARSLSTYVQRTLDSPGSTATEVPSQDPAPQDLSDEQKLLRAVRAGTDRIPEKSPRGWTIDLMKLLQPGQEKPFDREGDAVYATGNAELFVVFFTGALETDSFVRELRKQVKREEVWVVMASIPYGNLTVDPPEGMRFSSDVNRVSAEISQRYSSDLRGMHDDVVASVLQATHEVADMAIHGAPQLPVMSQVADAWDAHSNWFLGLFGGGGLLGALGLRSWLRNRPRICKGCQNPRHRLTEQGDDTHLSPGQKMEESLGSVDYDVWWCGRCNDALVLRYGAIFTSYSTCRSCSFKTLRSSTRTLVAATYDHGGTVEVTETCQQCSFANTYTRHTARLVRETSSSRSSSFSSSSSSSSSFGGGRSSGSGSSGSW